MIKDKITSLIKNNEGDNKKKIESLVFLLIILIVTIIAINYIWNDNDKSKKVAVNESKQLNTNNIESTSQEDNLDTKLENILKKINGVGKAEVLLTYAESTEIVPVYNKKEKTSNTDESDSGGGTRKIEEKDSSEEVVYTESSNKRQIATQKTVSPKIEGAIIIAEGAGDSNVKTNIIQAVEAATGLATHKIQVFKK